MSAIEAAWQELATAVAEVAPGLPFLLVPASAEQLTRCERTLGRALPAELRASLEMFGGDRVVQSAPGLFTTRGVFAALEWLNPGTIASEWESWDAADGDGLEIETHGPVRPLWWNPAWIPITLIGGATYHNCVDLDPAPGGTSGQVIEIGKEPTRIVVAPSLTELITSLAADVRAGVWVRDGDALALREDELDHRTLGGFRSPWYPPGSR